MRKRKKQTNERTRGEDEKWLDMQQQNQRIDVSVVLQYVLNGI